MAETTTTTTTTTATEAPPPGTKPAKAEKPVFRYVGDGSGRIPGAPLRDLSRADVDRLRPEVLREVRASRIYEGEG